MTQYKARRTNQIAFLPLPWALEVSGSNPGAPTNLLKHLRFFLRSISITLQLGNIWGQLASEQLTVSLCVLALACS